MPDLSTGRRSPKCRGLRPDTNNLADLTAAAQGCKGCDLYLHANQTVFGAGSPTADIVLVGEHGDQQDKAGAPLVGPAGKLLDKALAAAGIHRDRLYVTNAVKHFKFTLHRGRRLPAMVVAEMMSVRPTWSSCLAQPRHNR